MLMLVSQMTMWKGGHEAEKGCSTRNAGLDGAEDPRSAGVAAWVWRRAAHRADQRRPAFGQSGHAVSRPAEAGAGGRHRLGVGPFGKQSQGALLSADAD